MVCLKIQILVRKKFLKNNTDNIKKIIRKEEFPNLYK